MADQPTWRQGFDALEQQVSPRLEAVIRSESFAVAVGLAARAQRAVEGELARRTRQFLHRVNLPAGTDVSRILNEIGQLRVQVRELATELDEARAELAARDDERPVEPVAALPAERPARKRPAKRAAAKRGAA